LAGVFNTEAHPFKAPPAKSTYNEGVSSPTPTIPFTVQQDVPVAQISPCPALGDLLTKVITDVIFGAVENLLEGLVL